MHWNFVFTDGTSSPPTDTAVAAFTHCPHDYQRQHYPQCIASVGFPHDSACASAAAVCHVDLDSDWSSNIAAATAVGD